MSLQVESTMSLQLESIMSLQVESTMSFQVESTTSLLAESTISLPAETTISSPEKSECGSFLNESVFCLAPYHKVISIAFSVISHNEMVIRIGRSVDLEISV